MRTCPGSLHIYSYKCFLEQTSLRPAIIMGSTTGYKWIRKQQLRDFVPYVKHGMILTSHVPIAQANYYGPLVLSQKQRKENLRKR